MDLRRVAEVVAVRSARSKDASVPDRPDLFDDMFGCQTTTFRPCHDRARTRRRTRCPVRRSASCWRTPTRTTRRSRRAGGERIREHVHCCESVPQDLERGVRRGAARRPRNPQATPTTSIRRRPGAANRVSRTPSTRRSKRTRRRSAPPWLHRRWLRDRRHPRGDRPRPVAVPSRHRGDSRRGIDRARDGVRARAHRGIASARPPEPPAPA